MVCNVPKSGRNYIDLKMHFSHYKLNESVGNKCPELQATVYSNITRYPRRFNGASNACSTNSAVCWESFELRTKPGNKVVVLWTEEGLVCWSQHNGLILCRERALWSKFSSIKWKLENGITATNNQPMNRGKENRTELTKYIWKLKHKQTYLENTSVSTTILNDNQNAAVFACGKKIHFMITNKDIFQNVDVCEELFGTYTRGTTSSLSPGVGKLGCFLQVWLYGVGLQLYAPFHCRTYTLHLYHGRLQCMEKSHHFVSLVEEGQKALCTQNNLHFWR